MQKWIYIAGGVVVAGPAVREAWTAAVLAARQKQPLLIQGGPGSGKELVAKIFHARGPRAKGPKADTSRV